MTQGASGCDVLADLEKSLKIKPGERALIPTGIALAIPKGYEAQVRPRSGLAWKWGVTLPNTPGTIDSDYRGEIKVPLINRNPVEVEYRVAPFKVNTEVSSTIANKSRLLVVGL